MEVIDFTLQERSPITHLTGDYMGSRTSVGIATKSIFSTPVT